MKRTYRLEIRLSEEEHAKLQADLKACGLAQSTYLRELIMGRTIWERLPRDYYKLLTEVSRIGNNINQITRIANQQPEGFTDLRKVQLLQERIYALLSET